MSVLPNFAMTDYASQGKTRPVNVIDLHSCCSHMAYYTAISRGSSAQKTAIIQPFDETKITKGTSGYLRQEFHELELLDEITKHKFNGTLSKKINGKLRNTILHEYRGLKGMAYCPNTVPAPLKWTTKNPMNNLPLVTNSPWTFIDKNKTTKKYWSQTNQITNQYFVSAKGTIPFEVKSGIKRENVITTLNMMKKLKK